MLGFERCELEVGVYNLILICLDSYLDNFKETGKRCDTRVLRVS